VEASAAAAPVATASADDAAAQASATAGAPRGKAGGTAGTAGTAGKARKARKADGDQDTGKEHKKARKNDNAALHNQALHNQAKLLKRSYSSALANGVTMQSTLSSSEEWAWAHGLRHGLDKALAELDQVVRTNTFAHKFLTQEFSEVRKAAASGADFEVDLSAFVRTLAPLVDATSKETRVLMAQQNARLSA
jgi:hypothetical protein